MWAVVGLGNPGKRYSRTRHNVGFSVIKKLEKEWHVKVKRKMFFSKSTELVKNREKVLLAMPQTFMNNSGLAVKQILRGRKIQPEHLLIIYDDLDLPLGEIRVRKGGGAGTHKGMRSIIQEIHATNLPRIRIGIGPLPPDEDATDFVLSPFKKEELPVLEESLTKAQEALGMILSGDVDKAMNVYNRRGKAFLD